MDDLISRSAAIDALKRDEALVRAFGYQHAIDAVQALPSAQPEQQWIPVSEALPERGKEVLVTRDYDGRKDHNKSCRYVETASRYGEDDDVVWSSYSDEYKMTPKSHRVVAWIPLPEPWRGQDENDRC